MIIWEVHTQDSEVRKKAKLGKEIYDTLCCMTHDNTWHQLENNRPVHMQDSGVVHSRGKEGWVYLFSSLLHPISHCPRFILHAGNSHTLALVVWPHGSQSPHYLVFLHGKATQCEWGIKWKRSQGIWDRTSPPAIFEYLCNLLEMGSSRLRFSTSRISSLLLFGSFNLSWVKIWLQMIMLLLLPLYYLHYVPGSGLSTSLTSSHACLTRTLWS